MNNVRSHGVLLTDNQRRALLRKPRWRKLALFARADKRTRLHVIGEYGQVCCLKSPYHVPSERELWINSLGALLCVIAAGLCVIDYLLLFVL